MSGIASVRPSLSSGMDLLVRREGIRFHNEDATHVRIEVEVENHGFASSEPAELRLESAPFGAFVRWRPLARLVVPPIPPEGSLVVTAAAEQPRPQPLGGFANLAPAGLEPERLVPPVGLAARLTARVRATRTPAPGGQLALLLVNLILGGQASPRSTMGHLPPDLLDLLDDARPHWAGNLNVWIARRAVERHLAPRLRIQPARANLALFCLGDGPDTYAFRVERPGATAGEDWNVQLHDLQHELPMVWRSHREEPPRWYSIDGPSPVLLAFRPPAGAGAGKLEVHVTQRSTGEVATVEFDLDPAAAGPGCFLL
jgi:hypothetical protein